MPEIEEAFPAAATRHGDEARSASLDDQLHRAGYLHSSTFDYLKPTDEQIRTMAACRAAAAQYAQTIGALLPAGPDKTYMLRKFREVAMWANIAITREASGAPRE